MPTGRKTPTQTQTKLPIFTRLQLKLGLYKNVYDFAAINRQYAFNLKCVSFQGILIFSLIRYKRASYGEYTYPGWADGVGWCLALSSVLPIIIVAAVHLYQAEGDTLKAVSKSHTENLIGVEWVTFSALDFQ